MRAKVAEISWHDTQPVYSCDFQPLPIPQLKRILNFPSHTPAAPTFGAPAHGPSSSLHPASSPIPPHAEPVGGPGPSSTSHSRPPSETPPRDVGVKQSPAAGAASTTRGKDADHSVVRQYRLATAGADKHVRIWMVYPNVASNNAATTVPGLEVAPHPPRIVYLSTLKRHTSPVNVVRWNPAGNCLASAGDDGLIILWVPSESPTINFGDDATEEFGDKEYWRDKRAINVTKQSIYDIAWSPDGKYIIAGSTDNLAQIFNVADGSCVHQIQDHSHYVQGVAWDPLNEFVATQSSDRSVGVHTVSSRNGVLSVHPMIKDRQGRPSHHSSMEIRSSRPPSFHMPRPLIARRGSTTSDAGSAITSFSEMNDSMGMPQLPSASHTPIPSTPLSSMNPPQARTHSRRSSITSSHAAGSPLLMPTTRLGRSPSPAPLPAIRPAQQISHSIHQKLYGDELATNFFRRLSFSPDGGLLLTPAGQIEEPICPVSSSEDELPGAGSIPRPKSGAGAHVGAGQDGSSKSTVYVYSRANFSRPPIAHLPGHKTTTVAVRFSPIFYELRPMAFINTPPPQQVTLDRNNPAPVHVSISMPPPPPPASLKEEKVRSQPTPTSNFHLPYRLMFAVAAQDSVLLYDTQQSAPIAIFRGLHYSAFTDIAWSPTGDSLILASSDGYCSIVVFDAAELGALAPTQQHQRQLSAIAHSHSSGMSHPPSPALSNAMPSNVTPRHERESSSVSSLSMSTSGLPQLANLPNLHNWSSTASNATDMAILATPSEDGRDGYMAALGQGDHTSTADSDNGAVASPTGKAQARPQSAVESEEAGPKKKRAKLTHLGSDK